MSALSDCLELLAANYRGPGGAVAVVQDGAVLERHCWGWADTAARLPFTAATPFPICSITKQFTCGVVASLFPDPATLDALVAAAMPLLAGPPTTLQLCHNQSGLRDYWATAMLCGAPVEGVFTATDADELVARTRSLHFAPGTRYSYANQNFRLLADAASARTGRSFAELLRDQIFDRVGMAGAALTPEPASIPGGAVGYEGSVESGFRAAVNRIHWTGDAGITATLDDMIAWERFIDAGRDDPESLYNRLSGPVQFSDGRPAAYGFGLARLTLAGHAATGHGGALRGWRSTRLHVPARRLSVVVLFNHSADARQAAVDLVHAALGHAPPGPQAAVATSDWTGIFQEPETGLLARLTATKPNQVQLRYGQSPERLEPTGPDQLAGDATRMRRNGDALWMDRTTDGQSSQLTPVVGAPNCDVAGTFACDELGAELTITTASGVPYAAFSGFLGEGEMQPLIPVHADFWLLPMPRALDQAPPGDWTLQFHRDAAGQPAGVTVGCWLARRVPFRRSR